MEISWTHRVKNKKYYKTTGKKGTPYIQWNEGKLTGLVTSSVGTAF